MVRDYSQFLPQTGAHGVGTPKRTALQQLGWQPFFAQQTSVDDLTHRPPVRVVEVHRNGLHVRGDGIDQLIPPGPEATVGDWLLLDREQPGASRVLERKSLFKRRAPGTDRKLQLIAANVDTAFLVTSCNADFNVARLERYAALAFEAEVQPVIVLTKADLCEAPQTYVARAEAVSARAPVVAVNALSAEPMERLAHWCGAGQTVAFLGSSGVGKSTLVNGLADHEAAATAGIREDDAKGRHTTTRRQLHVLASGCAVLDTPGMRELQLTDAEAGIADVFADLAELATGCRFGDCQHVTEPGCAVQAAVARGEVEPDRLRRWGKLAAEERFNSLSLAERRAKDKSFGKMVRSAMAEKNARKR